ncbi:MAG: InlB B-repeat-containing protein [Clostridiales bacterium]|nr:InlB B-repeat-containing protein [Clostridiales bacterium]
MKNRKRIIKYAFLMLFVLSMLTACGKKQFEVTYNYNYDDAPDDYVDTVDSGSATTAPEDPTRESYSFTGWYTDADATEAVDFEVAITEAVTYYAGWEQTSAVVTLDLNYDGAESSTEEVEIGTSFSTPTTPTREGYLFTSWYTDADCTETYDFSTEVSGDLTLYAGWEEDDGESKRVTYMWNINDLGEYDTVSVKTLGYATEPELSLDGYYLEGWYTDKECTEKFEFASTRISDNLTLYAHWLNIAVFEAEYTDLTGLEGMGYSGNASGTNMIESDSERGASNGYYVGWLYNEGLTLTFNVESDEAVDNAIIALSLSTEYYDITITDETFTVSVNGEAVEYSDISFTGVTEMNLPFTTYILNTNVSLNEGSNVITISVTNNEKKTGTIYATAPLVDCMYIYSESEVTWSDGFPLESNIG